MIIIVSLVFFGIFSLILFNLSLFISTEQRAIVLGFSVISIIFAIVLFYNKLLTYMEKVNNEIKNNLDIIKV